MTIADLTRPLIERAIGDLHAGDLDAADVTLTTLMIAIGTRDG